MSFHSLARPSPGMMPMTRRGRLGPGEVCGELPSQGPRRQHILVDGDILPLPGSSRPKEFNNSHILGSSKSHCMFVHHSNCLDIDPMSALRTMQCRSNDGQMIPLQEAESLLRAFLLSNSIQPASLNAIASPAEAMNY